MSNATDFVPALGRKSLTWAYDIAIAVMTRESTWRGLLLSAVKPRPEDVILDVGCRTGTFAIMIKRQCPPARVVGLDPDPEVLRVARRKAIHAGVTIELIERRAAGQSADCGRGKRRRRDGLDQERRENRGAPLVNWRTLRLCPNVTYVG